MEEVFQGEDLEVVLLLEEELQAALEERGLQDDTALEARLEVAPEVLLQEEPLEGLEPFLEEWDPCPGIPPFLEVLVHCCPGEQVFVVSPRLSQLLFVCELPPSPS